MNHLKEFFQENPEASEAFTALGYACATEEEAKAILAGTEGHAIEVVSRAAFDATENGATAPVLEQRVEGAILTALSDEGLQLLVEKQRNLVRQRQAERETALSRVEAERAVAALR